MAYRRLDTSPWNLRIRGAIGEVGCEAKKKAYLSVLLREYLGVFGLI
jgi:hypothetical protein